jgi:hypothetical protein
MPLRTADDIKTDIAEALQGFEAGRSAERPSLNFWRDMIKQIAQNELELVQSEQDRDAHRDRTAVLAECLAWLDLFQQRYLHDANGNPIDVTHDDATMLAYNAIRVGFLMGQSSLRAPMESLAVEGLAQSERGRERAEVNRKRAFSITRDQLLAKCREKYRKHQCTQKRLAEYVAADLPIGRERVRKLMQEYGIKKDDYKK